MKRLLKVLCLVAALSLVSYGPVLAEVPVVLDVEIPIDVPIPVVDALEATLVGAISFNTTGVTTSAPWRVSSGYINVEYNCNTALWGVRFVTDNLTNYLGLVGFKVGDGGDGDWTDGDEILSYSGLINTDPAIYTTNPSMRAALGWQVYDVAPGSTPANPTDASFSTPEPWDSVWAYLADKSNDIADDDGVRTGTTVLDEGIITGTTPSGDNIFNYALIAYGGIGQGLAQHPMNDTNGDGVPEPKRATDNDADGKLDVAVYLAARFANTDYSDPSNPQDFVLPGGSYSTRLYIELIHE